MRWAWLRGWEYRALPLALSISTRGVGNATTLCSAESSTCDDEGAADDGGEAGGSNDGKFWGLIDAEPAGAIDFLGQQKGGPHTSSLLFLRMRRGTLLETV
jgi:hypothetical protein